MLSFYISAWFSKLSKNLDVLIDFYCDFYVAVLIFNNQIPSISKLIQWDAEGNKATSQEVKKKYAEENP